MKFLIPLSYLLYRWVCSLAASPHIIMKWNLEPGDIQMLSNHTTIHNRD